MCTYVYTCVNVCIYVWIYTMHTVIYLPTSVHARMLCILVHTYSAVSAELFLFKNTYFFAASLKTEIRWLKQKYPAPKIKKKKGKGPIQLSPPSDFVALLQLQGQGGQAKAAQRGGHLCPKLRPSSGCFQTWSASSPWTAVMA